MQHAWSQCYRKVIFEGDCKQLMELINGTCLDFGSFNWLRDVWHWRRRFEDIQFNWIPRTANAPADLLAKSDIPNNSFYFFHTYVPRAISNALHCNQVSNIKLND